MNVNDHVWVKLTPAGVEAYKKWNEDLGIKDPVMPKVEWDGFSKFQLWELMMIFGSTCHNGGHIPFETEIQLSRT
jgi:hypothetical protein